MPMRYRRLGYRYTMIQRGTWSVTPAPWAADVLNLLLPSARWSPDVDICETPSGIEVVVDLAGVQEDDVEVRLFDDALVVQGQRHLPACEEGSVYHAVGIQQGPFRLELPLPALVDAVSVRARYERGLLRISLRKQEARG